MLHCRARSASCVSAGCLESSIAGCGNNMYTAHGTGGQSPPATIGVSLPTACQTVTCIQQYIESELEYWRKHLPKAARCQLLFVPAEYVLPSKKAAAEELRLQTTTSKTPSMGSAARAAAAVRSEHEDLIQSLYADICKVCSPLFLKTLYIFHRTLSTCGGAMLGWMAIVNLASTSAAESQHCPANAQHLLSAARRHAE